MVIVLYLNNGNEAKHQLAIPAVTQESGGHRKTNITGEEGRIGGELEKSVQQNDCN